VDLAVKPRDDVGSSLNDNSGSWDNVGGSWDANSGSWDNVGGSWDNVGGSLDANSGSWNDVGGSLDDNSGGWNDSGWNEVLGNQGQPRTSSSRDSITGSLFILRTLHAKA
jgi:hypothetical protein